MASSTICCVEIQAIKTAALFVSISAVSVFCLSPLYHFSKVPHCKDDFPMCLDKMLILQFQLCDVLFGQCYHIWAWLQ